MEELNFFPLIVPSNIYGFAHLKGDKSRFLVATLEKQIFCIEYSDNQFTCTEVHFTYIPNGAEIISIDAFRRTKEAEASATTSYDIVVGITIFKNSKESDSNELRKNVSQSSSRTLSNSERTLNHYYFNVYSSFSTNRFDLNQVAQDCQTFELEFVPFHLYHTSLKFADRTSENVWLLSGSDCCVHLYREDLKKQCFYKEKLDLFPELNNYKSIALWIDVMHLDHNDDGLYRRLSVIGCEDGSVELFLVEYGDATKPEIVRSFKNQFDGPILSVRLFRDSQTSTQQERSLKRRLQVNESDSASIHLLVANSYEEPVVYRNVLRQGMVQRKVLPTHNKMDILLATFIADFNFDGENEILLGKYSKELITYRYSATTEAYEVSNQIKFANPIQVIAYLDITGNGIKELVIITTKGVVIQRHKFSEVAKILQDKVALCLSLIGNE